MSTANQAINNPEKPTAPPNAASGAHNKEEIHDKVQSRPDIAGDSEKDHQQGAPDSDYPPQLHAGKVGYGPHYAETHGKVSMGDKIRGIELDLKGKITRNHKVEQKGRDKFTGEAKREMDEDAGKKAFKNADEDDKKDDQHEVAPQKQEDSEQETKSS